MREETKRRLLVGSAVLLCTALGGALRVHGITNASLWVDEIYGLREMTAPSWAASLVLIRDDFSKTPIDFLLGRLFHLITGAQLEMMRLWPALAGTLAIPVTWFWMRAFRVRGAAPLAALLLALSAFHITHSQDLKMYSLFSFFTAAVLWAFTRMMNTPHERKWPPLFALMLWLAYHTCALAVLLAIPLGAALLLDTAMVLRRSGLEGWRQERRTLWLRLLAALGIAALACLPWYLWDTRHEGGIEAYGMQIPHGVDANRIIEAFFQVSGRSVVLMAVFAVAIIVGAAIAWRRGDALPAGLALGLMLLIAVQAWLMVRGHYWFLLRQCVHLAPLWLGLAALGMAPVVEMLWRRSLLTRGVAVAFSVMGLALLWPGLRAVRGQWSEDWRGAAHLAAQSLRPQDTLVLHHYSDYFAAYWPEVTTRVNADLLSAEELAAARQRGRVVVFLCNNRDVAEWQQQRQALENFPRVTLGLWAHAQWVVVPQEGEAPAQVVADLVERLPAGEHDSQWLLGSLAQQAVVQSLPWVSVTSLLARMESSRLAAEEPCELLALSLLRRGYRPEAEQMLRLAIEERRRVAARTLAQRPLQWEGIAADQEALGQSDAAAASRRWASWWKRLIPNV